MSESLESKQLPSKEQLVVKFYCERIQTVHIINSGSERHGVLTSSLGVLWSRGLGVDRRPAR